MHSHRIDHSSQSFFGIMDRSLRSSDVKSMGFINGVGVGYFGNHICSRYGYYIIQWDSLTLFLFIIISNVGSWIHIPICCRFNSNLILVNSFGPTV